MALGSTQPLAELSTRNLPGGNGTAEARVILGGPIVGLGPYPGSQIAVILTSIACNHVTNSITYHVNKKPVTGRFTS
jgi:hypothetical protein